MSTGADNGDSGDGEATGGSVPEGEQGVGLGAGTEPSTFEPEEDPEAIADDDGEEPGPAN